MDILVCMAGTGGTGFGTASYLRSRNPNLQVVLVQPHPDSRLTPEHPDAQIIDGVLPAYDVPEELFAKLKATFTEEEIVIITAMGVMMIANNYFNDILDVTPDKLV